MTPDDYVRLCRARGIVTETRLRRAVRRQYPHLEEWQIVQLTKPIQDAPLWTAFNSRGNGTIFGSAYVASGDPVLKPWKADG